MSRKLPDPGTYKARLNGKMVVEQTKKGALLVWIPYRLCDLEVPYSGKHMLVVGLKDGTLNQKAIEALKEAFSWDGSDIFDLEQIEVPEGDIAQFVLADCEHDDSYTPDGEDDPVIQFKAKWFNPLSGASRMPKPLEEEERQKVHKRWANKLKAISGSKKKKAKDEDEEDESDEEDEESDELDMGDKKESDDSEKDDSDGEETESEDEDSEDSENESEDESDEEDEPPKKKSSKGEDKSDKKRTHTDAMPRTSSQQEVWKAYEKKNPKQDRKALGKLFWEKVDKYFPDADSELTPKQWGTVADKLGL